ncbi:hypothetical protein GCM10023063_25960 [Arthrobacter methylotrophus]|uniref:SnoaL-like domain-containing protein n=1 Tax=Arthrobacter methylotrophus TaxID=121291 RepID=A0ABV5UMA3_9MICC
MMNLAGDAMIPQLVTNSEFRVGEHFPGGGQPPRAGLNDPAAGDDGRAPTFRPLPLCMELNLGGVAMLRHHVENLLSLWCSAADAGDCGLLGVLLGDASLYMDDECFTSGSPGMSEFLRLYTREKAQSTRVFTNLSVWCDSDFGYYSCSVQTWTLGSEWTCNEVSSYEGRLKSGPQVWKWDQHRVRKLGKGEDAPL